jgi:hypothetical protein
MKPLALIVLLILTCPLSPAMAEPPHGRVTVLSPPYGSTISGPTMISIAAPGFSSVMVKCWKQGSGWGSDSVVGNVALDAAGRGSIRFPADQYPHGPITVRLSASTWSSGDNCYLQLYNEGGVAWQQGIPATPAPEAKGMSLVFADDFDHPLSISSTDPHATYFDHKPGGGDFSALPFTGIRDPNNPFSQVDSYLRIRADEKTRSAGLISSLKWDDSGVKARVPCYFECRFIAPSAPGTWPAFWIMTDYMTDRLQGRDVPVDELDIIEGYGGEGPHNPTKSSDTSDAAYIITSHFWNQGAAGQWQKGVYNHIYERKIGGKAAWWETFHTYGCKITDTDTIYYCDDVEVGRHPTGAISKKYPFFFLIDLAVGGDGWPVDLSRYNGIADMYVDYVRVYSGAGADNASAPTAP